MGRRHPSGKGARRWDPLSQQTIQVTFRGCTRHYRRPLVATALLRSKNPPLKSKIMEPAKASSRSCAIYTRKSSEDGLEQDFNSLQAQREACEAFIKSQAGEGWRLVKTAYDDGGLSGGTMERPALQRLLSDIDEGRIDTVVV